MRAQKTELPWRIGVLFSRTGFMSVIEETQYYGTMLAIEEINSAGGINGRELIPVRRRCRLAISPNA